MHKKNSIMSLLLITFSAQAALEDSDDKKVLDMLGYELDPLVQSGAGLTVLAQHFHKVVTTGIAGGNKLIEAERRKGITGFQQTQHPEREVKKRCSYIVCAVGLPLCLAVAGYVAATFSY